VIGDQALRRLGDDHMAGGRRLLKARRDVRRVADRRVVHPQVVSDAADHDEAGIQPLTDLEADSPAQLKLCLEGIERIADRERRVHGALRVVFMCDRRAEQRHDAVAEELVDGAFVAVHRVEQQLERARHRGVDILRIEPLAERGEARDVHEVDRHLLPLSGERRGRGEDLGGEMTRRVGAGRSRQRDSRRRRGERIATAATEVLARGVRESARRARAGQRGSALRAEPPARPILVVALDAARRIGGEGSFHGHPDSSDPAAGYGEAGWRDSPIVARPHRTPRQGVLLL
jgi:hypothetical protein